MLTPLGKQPPSPTEIPYGDSGAALGLHWHRMLRPHPPDSAAAVDAIDNALRGWFGGIQDTRIPRDGLRWTRDYRPSHLRQYL